MKKIIIILMIVFFFPFGLNANSDNDYIKSVVKIKVWDKNLSRFDGYGSGVVIGMTSVLTNYHVVEPSITNPERFVLVICSIEDVNKEPNCSFSGSATRGMFGEKLEDYNKDLDLALVAITGKIFDLESWNVKEYLELTAQDILPAFVKPINLSVYGNDKLSEVRKGDKVEAVGFPAERDGELSRSSGEVLEFVVNNFNIDIRIVTSARITPGNSGGGAYDVNGNFLGVTTGYYADENDDFLFGSIVPVTTVNWWMKNVLGYKVFSDGTYSKSEVSEDKIKEALDMLSVGEVAEKTSEEEKKYECIGGKIIASLETDCASLFGKNSKRVFEFNNDGGFNIFCSCGFEVNSTNLPFIKKNAGRIFLQVESHGEAWYVNPLSHARFYLGRPNDAFNLMRSQGIGITNKNLDKITVGKFEYLGEDSDGDGLPDRLEDAIGTDKNLKDTDGDGYDDAAEVFSGYNPKGSGSLIDNNFTDGQKGKILLQVESRGEAWYVNPTDGKRYFLGKPEDAFNVMKNLGMGISNSDIEKISIGI